MKTITSLPRFRFLTVLAFTILSMVIALPSAKAQSSELSADTKAEVEKLNKEIEHYVQKKDLASMIDLYSDEATIIVPGGKKIQGRKAIAEYWYSLSNVKELKSEITELGGNGKIIYQLGKWTIVSVKDGVEKTTTSDIMLVWKRQQNYGYKIQLNSSNNPVALNTVIKSEPYEAARP